MRFQTEQQPGDDASSGPRAETPEAIAEEIGAGRTVLWCDGPALDGTATAAGCLHVLGWAYCARA